MKLKDIFKYKAYAENKTNKKIKVLRTDNGLEYCGKDFDKRLENFGIERQRTVAYTPQQNGIAERMNRTLVEMARCMLLESGVSTGFWAEAIQTAAYIRNRCPSRSLTENITAYEIWYKHKPDILKFLEKELLPLTKIQILKNFLQGQENVCLWVTHVNL